MTQAPPILVRRLLLDQARRYYALEYRGSYVLVRRSSATAAITLHLDEPGGDGIPLTSGHGFAHAPFQRLYLSHPAQEGQWVELVIAGDPEHADRRLFSAIRPHDAPAVQAVDVVSPLHHVYPPGNFDPDPPMLPVIPVQIVSGQAGHLDQMSNGIVEIAGIVDVQDRVQRDNGRVRIWDGTSIAGVDATGPSLLTRVNRWGAVTVANAASPADAVSNSNAGPHVNARLQGFNGTTWDRLRSTIAGGLQVEVTNWPDPGGGGASDEVTIVGPLTIQVGDTAKGEAAELPSVRVAGRREGALYDDSADPVIIGGVDDDAGRLRALRCDSQGAAHVLLAGHKPGSGPIGVVVVNPPEDAIAADVTDRDDRLLGRAKILDHAGDVIEGATAAPAAGARGLVVRPVGTVTITGALTNAELRAAPVEIWPRRQKDFGQKASAFTWHEHRATLTPGQNVNLLAPNNGLWLLVWISAWLETAGSSGSLRILAGAATVVDFPVLSTSPAVSYEQLTGYRFNREIGDTLDQLQARAPAAAAMNVQCVFRQI
jgi:hypothetical protein